MELFVKETNGIRFGSFLHAGGSGDPRSAMRTSGYCILPAQSRAARISHSMNTNKTARIPMAFWVVLTSLLFSLTPIAWGQATPYGSTETQQVSPENLTSDQVDDLVARLSDEEVRELLIRQLDKTATTEETTEHKGAVIERFMNGMQNAEVRIRGIASVMGDMSQLRGVLWSRITAGSDASIWGVWLKIMLFFAVGVIVEKLFRRSVASIGKPAVPEHALSFAVKLKLSIVRAIVEGVSILVFALGSVIAWLVSDLPTDNARLLFTTLLTGVIVWRFVATGSRIVLAPRLPRLRLVDLDDVAARGAHFKLMLIVSIVIFLLWLSGELMREFGIDPDVRGAVVTIYSAIWICSVIWVIWSLRPATSKGTGDSESTDYFSRNWHIMAIIGTLLVYVLALGVNFATGARTLMPAIASLIVIGCLPILDSGLRGLVHRFMTATEEDSIPAAGEISEGPADRGYTAEPAAAQAGESMLELADGQSEASKKTGNPKSYESVVVNNIRILLLLFAVFAFAGIWDLNLFGIMKTLFGERITSVVVNFSITALLAYALWGIVSAAVARVAGPESESDLSGDEGGGEGSRLGTVLPLFKKFLLITLIIMLVLIFLSSLGVDIGPLIAGAGIVGIAIGFGAQTLVKDIVSGLFFLLDDAFRVGEYVTIGDTKGTVEKISVRSLRLRHHNGPLHTVPFGEIQTLTNWSRDYAIMKFEIRVPFETDVDLVRRIIKKVGQAMLEDEELGPMFLEPLKSQGVNRMDDSSFIIRCKFTSKPGNQFYMRREAFARIQAAFEAKGIKFAPKRVIVETASPNVPPEVAAAAAASESQADKTPQHVEDEPG